MRNDILRARILVAIGATGLALSACGGDDNAASTSGGAGTSASAGASGMSGTGGSAGGSAGALASTGGSMNGAGGSGGTSAAGGAAGSASKPDGSVSPAGDASEAATNDAPSPSDASSKDEPAVCVRRPFLVGSSLRFAEVIERGDWCEDLPPVGSIDSQLAGALAASWLKDGIEEHASIAAFARFTMLLLSVGAPPDLVVLSQRASLDEVQHARACFALAQRYGSREVGPGPLRVADSLGAFSLADLVVLTVEEGCVGETLGALLASEQLARASDPHVVRVLRKIAADEARHAELAWKFVKWAVETGGEEVADRARVAMDRACAEIGNVAVLDYGVDLDAWHVHGRLSCAEAREVSRRGIRDVILPCMEALLVSKDLLAQRPAQAVDLAPEVVVLPA